MERDFTILREGALVGPTSAEGLRSAGGVRPEDRLRLGEEGPFLHLAELLAKDPEVAETLEEGLEPDEPPKESWQLRPLTEISWVAILLAADAYFLVRLAARSTALAHWLNPAVIVFASAVAVYGVLGRRPWAWPLTALLTGSMAAWLLAPLIASGDPGTAVWAALNLLATAFVLFRAPRGAALDWPARRRRLLLAYSTDPKREARTGPARSAGSGPVVALVGAAAFFGIVLGGVALYHGLRFPDRPLELTLVPRGADTWGRLAVTSVYLVMIALAWLLGRRGKPPSAALGFRLRLGARHTLWTGARLFLALFLVLLTGRWALRSAEAVEERLTPQASAPSDDAPGAATEVREAVREALDRAPRQSQLSIWVLLVALVLGPVCEEIFFRGLLFGALRRRWPFWGAAAASAAVFALAHWLGSGWGPAAPVLLFEVAAGGVAAAYAYELTGSLLAPIGLHVLWNAAQTLAGMLPSG